MTAGKFADLRLRLLTGVGLGLFSLVFLWYSALSALFLVGFGTMVSLVEYHRMLVGRPFGPSLGPMLGAGLACLVAAHMHWPAALLVAVGLATFTLVQETNARMLAVGTLYISLAFAAMIALRGSGGLHEVLWLVLVVIATDVGAYFAGRMIGGPKLWPAVSPGKTWSGAGGAVVAATLMGGIAASGPGWTLPLGLAVGLSVGIAAIAGDLAESAVKRRYGVKDAGSWLPGHGGILDRLDGVMAAAIFLFICERYLGPLQG